MSLRQNMKMQPLKRQAERQMKYLTVHSRSKEKSSSGDDKKSEGSLRKIFYKHEIFDKRKSPIKFKPLNQIKEQQSPPMIKKHKSSQQLNWKEKVISILEKEQAHKNQYNKSNQREKHRSDSSRSASKDNSQKNIQILQIQNHQILDQRKQLQNEKQQRNQRGVKSSGSLYKSSGSLYKSSGSLYKSSGQLKARQLPQHIAQRQKQPHKQLNPKFSLQTHMQITTIQKHAFDRDSQILQHKYQSNLKYLTAQTSQLLSYNKYMLLEQQLAQTKRQMSELNIFIRKLRIDMRNHDYTKEINFTFPVQKHNDQIFVKMPEKVQDKDMGRYFLILERLQAQRQVSKQQHEKIDHLEAYYQTLVKKYQPILASVKIAHEVEKLSASNKSIPDQHTNKLQKSKSSQQMTVKSSQKITVKFSNIDSSLASSNSRSPIKKVISQVNILTPIKRNQAQLYYTRYQTLLQKKQALKESLREMRVNIEVKTARVVEEIKLLKKQIALIDSNIKSTDQSKAFLVQQIQSAKNKREQKQQNIQRQYQVIANQRRVNYQKEKQKRNIQTKGFTLFLRSNKSLSPVNYVSTPTNKLASNHSPRQLKRPQLNALNAQQLTKNNIQNVQSAKLIKINK